MAKRWLGDNLGMVTERFDKCSGMVKSRVDKCFRDGIGWIK